MKILVESIETGSAHITGLEREKLRRPADPAAREGSVPRSFPVAFLEDAVVGRSRRHHFPDPSIKECLRKLSALQTKLSLVIAPRRQLGRPALWSGQVVQWVDRVLGEARTDQAEPKMLYTPSSLDALHHGVSDSRV
jgi:hypothetical protein